MELSRLKLFGKNVLIQKEKKELSNVGLYVDREENETNKGTVLASGKGVSINLKPGDRIVYQPFSSQAIDEDKVIISEASILARL